MFIVDVLIAVNYQKYKRYQYEDLPEHTYDLLRSTLKACMKDGTIVDYLIITTEV